MSNNGAARDYYPAFASGAQESHTPERVEPRGETSGWDNTVAAVRSATKKGQPLLLTLTADNMTPIWLDLYTKRYYTETPLDSFPEDTLNPKLYAKNVDPNDPPFPWVAWRSIDAILWSIGEKAFAHKSARWLVPGERYSLVRWPNLTQIPYGSDELNAVSMLANGLLTVEELALVSKITQRKSEQLISTLSFMGVLRGTGVSSVAVPGALSSPAIPAHEEPVAEQNIIESASSKVIEDAGKFKAQIEKPALSSMSLPELPEDLFHHDYSAEDAQEKAELPETSTPPAVDKPLEAPKAERPPAASRFSGMPSFESILEAQNLESAALDSLSDEGKKESKEKSSGGLFGLLKLKLGKK